MSDPGGRPVDHDGGQEHADGAGRGRIAAPHDDLGALVEGSVAIAPVAEGPLSGVEAVLKDCFAVEGHTNSNGSRRWLETHGPATRNSSVASSLLSAGAALVGMGRMDQIAFSLVGNTPDDGAPTNPRHPHLYCGGSSAGSASAVAGGRAALGIGTDTAGSVRVPAALCGVHGLRPTWGSIDMAGCIPLAPSFDTTGILAANPLVMQLALRVLSELPRQQHRFSRVLVDPALAERPEQLADTARGVAAALGTGLDFVELGHLVNRDVGALHNRLQGREVWACRGRWAEGNMDALDADVANRLRACEAFAAEDAETIEVDLRDRRMFADLLAGIVDDATVLVKPVLGAPLPAVDATPADLASFRRSTIPLCSPAGLAGWPELTWSGPEARDDPSRAVGLLARPAHDAALVELLGLLSSRGESAG